MVRELRLAARLLWHTPGFSLVALLSLGLGIGANTALFSLINTVILRPMPVGAPEQLVSVYQVDTANPGNLPVSHLNFKDLRAQGSTLQDLAAMSFSQVTVQEPGGEAVETGIQLVTGNYFEVMEVRMAAGRPLRAEDDTPGGGRPVAVLSWPYWQRRYGGRPVVGESITINRQPFAIVGVTPRGFTGTFAIAAPSLWVPMATHSITQPDMEWYEERRGLFLFPVGRLRDGVTAEQAQANLKGIMANLSRQFPKDNARRDGLAMVPLAESRIDPDGRGQLVRLSQLLVGVVGVVLVIACANLANLLLARASRRQREMALRMAIGANRRALIRQLLTESLVLAVAGGLVGLLLARVLLRLIAATPDLLPFPVDDIGPALDPRVLAFTGLVTIATGVLFGLAPALQASKTDVLTALKQGGAAATGQGGWLRKGLVAAQVALSVVSLVAAGWFLQSLSSTVTIDPGFTTREVAASDINLGREGYDESRGLAFYRALIEKAAALPGAVSAAVAESVPLGGTQIARSVFLPTTGIADRDARLVPINYVSPGYFSTVGIDLVAGRDFGTPDRVDSPAVAIVNETMASQFWPGESAVGQRFTFFGETVATEVIGVARNSKTTGLAEQPAPLIYEPIFQDYRSRASVLVRFSRPSGDASASMRQLIGAMDPALAVLNVRTLEQQVRASLTGQRTLTGLIGIFGALAVLLASTGIYGVASYWVNQRRRELGVRMALGADPRRVISLVLRQMLTVVAVGLAVGVIVAAVAAATLGSGLGDLLVGVAPTDPLTFVATAALLVFVAALACAWPARRAARIDPLIALKLD